MTSVNAFSKLCAHWDEFFVSADRPLKEAEVQDIRQQINDFEPGRTVVLPHGVSIGRLRPRETWPCTYCKAERDQSYSVCPGCGAPRGGDSR